MTVTGRTDLSQATLQLCRLTLSQWEPCRADGPADIEEITSYFEDDKYIGEVVTWRSQHGTYQAIVRPRHEVCSA